jgi:putative phage-type endonuclease
MSAVFVGTFEPGSPEWHAARARGIGGSEVAPILGLSPFESRFGLWHRKHGDLGPVEENPEMYWGKILEPVIRDEFEARHGNDWCVETTGMWRHSDREWQIGNPDALLHRGTNPRFQPDALLECKLSMFGDGWGEDGTDEVPPHVRCQVLWYLDVFGIDTAYVAVLIAGGLDFRCYEIRYDEVEAAELRDAAERFLMEVERGVRPDIDAHTATYQAIKELHPDIDGTEVELTGDTAARFINTKTAEKIAKDSAREATARVADEMGTAARATWDGKPIASRQVRDGGIPFVKAARGLSNGGPVDHQLAGVAAGSWTDPETGETF